MYIRMVAPLAFPRRRQRRVGKMAEREGITTCHIVVEEQKSAGQAASIM